MNFWENSSGDNGSTAYGSRGADVADRLSMFEGKSEEELFSELTKAVDKLKAEGKFDPSALERLYLTASPFLSEGQRERMRAIIDALTK